MRRIVRALPALIIFGLLVFWYVTRPGSIDPEPYASLQGDVALGEIVFNAGGCASCHSAPKAEGEAKLILAGGKDFPSDFGTFYAPNLSPSPEGIGGWSTHDLATAMIEGVSPEGTHYYPAFPFTSYTHVTPEDVAHLKAYLDTLPPDATPNKPHDVSFPFSWRRVLGGWKFLFLRDDWQIETVTEEQARGRYLVEGLGHCSECHTSRNPIGGLVRSKWMAGGPNPDGKGRIPNITPHDSGIGSWSEADLVEYLTSGFTPEFDVAGGQMADVIENTGKLPEADRRAIVAYLALLPALPAVPGR